ncbi:MAG: hypothetical protein VXW60_02185 [Bacteroidota bacterium]|nr:hypothetical protein [Bacteroidota bacterium]MEC7617178.1 hypothetical protein [Bacteroidota bacterium]MED5363458.1 hypothetical protein [Bacteroidota bacterium]
MEQLPEFLLADSSESPASIFVIHTTFPRFVINLQNDEIEWWESFNNEEKDIAVQEVSHWVKEATQFYDREISTYE